MTKQNRRTPSDDKPRGGPAGRGKTAMRYTTPTGRADKGAAGRRRAVTGGPRRGGRTR